MFLLADKNMEVEGDFAYTHTETVGFKHPIFIISADKQQIYTKIIDDEKGVEFYCRVLHKNPNFTGYFKVLKKIGATIAEQALAANITEVDVCSGAATLNRREIVILKAARKAGLKISM